MSEFDFNLNNPGLDESHIELNSYIYRGESILSDLDPVLNQMFVATENSGIQFWTDMRTKWTTHYTRMMTDLGLGLKGSQAAQDAFIYGDNQATRALL